MNRIRAKILELLSKRNPSETICPSEAARALFPDDWRDHMEQVRNVARTMKRDGLIDITQKGVVVSDDAQGPIRLRLRINYRENPELYRVLRGEQGVLTFEPYKSELLSLWRFKTPDIARESSKKLLEKFYEYRKELDFAGMDMARKFIQMGYTRSRRYANHKSGTKYAEGEVLPLDEDPVKAQSAAIFKSALEEVESDPVYKGLRKEWKLWYG